MRYHKLEKFSHLADPPFAIPEWILVELAQANCRHFGFGDKISRPVLALGCHSLTILS